MDNLQVLARSSEKFYVILKGMDENNIELFPGWAPERLFSTGVEGKYIR